MHSEKTRGSGLFVVLIIATALGIGIYSTLDLVDGEFKRNHKAAVYHEAKQAAESLLQASMADLKGRFEIQTAFPINALSPSRNPLYISSEFASQHTSSGSNSHLLIPTKLKYSSPNEFNSEDTEVIGGQVPPGRWVYIDPRIPGNQFDELAGTRVFERNIEMISKATVERAGSGRATVYARQFMQVRDAPLFAYAIFYNLPMEIAPGPPMDVSGGGVHSNKPSWFQANNQLNIHTKVTIAGEMLHGRHSESGQSQGNGAVRIKNGSGDLVNMKKDSSWPSDTASEFSGSWLTSLSDDFYDFSNQIWDSNVQTGDHGVLPQNPVGVSDYIEDTDSSTQRKESFNPAYSLIQPTLEASELSIPDAAEDPTGYEAAKKLNEIEEQKYSYKAGLKIEVEDDGDIRYYTYDRNNDGTLKYVSNEPKLIELSPSESIASYRPFTEVDGDITSGLHDKRQAKDLNIIEVDIEKLKDLVHDNQSGDWGGGTENKPESWWNGIVYVDFPQQNAQSNRPDYVNPAKSGWGVKLVNGNVIPNPSFAHSKDTYGMSIATNQMMYVQGDYNADGDLNTGSATAADDPSTFGQEGHEAPAALIADSITFLSDNWDDENSTKNKNSHRNAVNTEVSAAVLTGIVPSGETGSDSYSGGVENFPRFLERWTDKTIQIRGSMVCLFESEVGTRGWGHGDVYDAPNRAWGFHDKFGEGYLPPGTPNTRRYRGIDFQLVNKSQYEEYVTRIQNYF